MSGIIDTAVRRSKTVWMVLAFILSAGLFSYMAIPKEAEPDIPIPIIYVSMHYEGISPEDAVNLLIKPMEEELKNIEGLDELEATGYESGANIVLSFEAGFDNDAALEDVRAKVDIAKAELPQEADEPKVQEVNFAQFPILTVILSGQLPERMLKRTGEALQDQLETIPGVLEAQIVGTREEQVVIEIDRAKMESYGLTQADLGRAVVLNNQLVTAGSLEMETGRFAVKVPGLIHTARDLYELPIKVVGERTIHVRDIATIKPTFKDPQTITRVNGTSAITLEVRKRIGANVIETVDRVKARVANFMPQAPPTLTVNYTNDKSKQIRTQLSDLQNNVIIAVLLVMVVLIIFMGPRPASLVAIAIPASFLLGLMMIYVAGLSANIVVLFALILSVGMLVDGAIVVTELADQLMQKGTRRTTAYIEAAQYMAWPIIASTATTLAAFAPLLFWPDIVGEFMKFLPLTLIFILSASLLMALIFLPTIGSAVGGISKNAVHIEHATWVKTYIRLLERAIKHPGKVLAVTVVGFVASIMLYAGLGKGVEFFPDIEPEQAQIKIHVAGDLSIYQQDDIMRKVESRILNLPEVETFYTVTGQSSRKGQEKEDVIGTITLAFKDWEDRDRTAKQVLAEVQKRTDDLYGIRVETDPERRGPSQGKPIKIVVAGTNVEKLRTAARIIQAELKSINGTKAVENTLPEPGIEWSINIDRTEAAKAGTALQDVGTALSMATNGVIVDEYRPADSSEEVDIVARFKGSSRTLNVIDTMTVGTDWGQVPVSNFMTRTPKPKVTTIQRLDQDTVYYVESDIQEGYLADDVVRQLRANITSADLPQGVRIEFKGDDEDQKKSADFLKRAFLIALFIMAIILTTQFNSYGQTLIILSAVVLSTTGVLLGHLLIGQPFGIVMSGLGVIALAGIVVNNNIVLIDTYNKNNQTMPWREALIETGRSRLRPVLLTATTTIIGLMPMATKVNINLVERVVIYNSPSTQWWHQLANSIIFGLAFATVLTLVITPCMIAFGNRVLEKRGKSTT